MILDQDLLEKLDDYYKGGLSASEKNEIDQRMASDAAFRAAVEEHFLFLKNMRQLNERDTIKRQLASFHNELPAAGPEGLIQSERKQSFMGKYWPTIAVAASVALISVVGTLLTTQSINSKRQSEYRELTRKVDQIKKSQQAIIADIAAKESKEAEVTLAKYTGTGFLVSSNGYLLTSAHVVRDADSVYVENSKFGRLKAEVIKTDLQNDVAILRIDQTRITLPYTIAKNDADLGETVFTLGFPREDIVYGEGTVSASSGYRQNESSYQIAVPVNPGNSGGPLLNSKGDIVGMISGLQTETFAAAFAVKSKKLVEVIQSLSADSLKTPFKLPGQNRMRGMNRVDQVRKMQDYVFIVKVYNAK